MKSIYAVINRAFCCGYTTPFNLLVSYNNKRRVLLAFVICGMVAGIGNIAHAQQTGQAKLATEFAPAKEGTYQLIFSTREAKPNIKLNEFELQAIERLRKDDEIVYAQTTYSDAIKVRIMPRNFINNPAFKPLPLYYFKDEHPYEEYARARYVELQ